MINPGFMVKITLNDFKFTLKEIKDSHLNGKINPSYYNALFNLFNPMFVSLINTIFAREKSLNWLLEYLDLTFVGLDDSKLSPFAGYFIFYCTPTFNI